MHYSYEQFNRDDKHLGQEHMAKLSYECSFLTDKKLGHFNRVLNYVYITKKKSILLMSKDVSSLSASFLECH